MPTYDHRTHLRLRLLSGISLGLLLVLLARLWSVQALAGDWE